MVDTINTLDVADVSALVSPMREKLRQTVTLNADPPANSKTSPRSDVCAEEKQRVPQVNVQYIHSHNIIFLTPLA